jgi:hypothetical protein
VSDMAMMCAICQSPMVPVEECNQQLSL